MARVSRNASIPYRPYSRPTPEYLKPPHGACGSSVMPLMTTRPARSCDATRLARWRSDLSLREGHLLRHDGELAFVDESLFGKATQPKTLEQASTALAQSRGIVRSAQRRLWMVALERAAGETSRATAACLRERPYDVFAAVDLRDVRANGGHDSCDFVPQHRGYWHDVVGGEQEVRVTEA
jgi:hypothetical protein